MFGVGAQALSARSGQASIYIEHENRPTQLTWYSIYQSLSCTFVSNLHVQHFCCVICRTYMHTVCRLKHDMVLHMFDARDCVGIVAACQQDEEEDAVGELQPVDMKQKRGAGLNRGWQTQQAKARKKNTRSSLGLL